MIALLSSQFGQAQTEFSVYFDFNKHELTPAARASIDSFLRAASFSLANGVISIHGHCDSIGSDNYNDRLSIFRVDAVKKYLLKKSLEPKSIGNTMGHGEGDPQYENETVEGRQLNRRVTIVIKNEESRSLTEKITDTATIAGTNIVLSNINFYGGTPFLLPESSVTLDELLQVMKRHPTLVVAIEGHICCVSYAGDSPYGNAGTGLSEERARAIWAHLVGNGIAQERVSYKGYGHSQPIYPYPEKTESERTLNRRVEIKIISK